jgi:hypothetical protein
MHTFYITKLTRRALELSLTHAHCCWFCWYCCLVPIMQCISEKELHST